MLWSNAPHIIWPMRFVLPYAKGPAPGLADAARPLPLRPHRRPQAAAGHHDARHAQRSGRQAAEAAVHEGLRIFRRLGQRCAAGRAQCARRRRSRRDRSAPARRSSSARREDGHLDARRRGYRDRTTEEVSARLLVNAAGPWVDHVLAGAVGQNDVHNVRLVQGSHIVVPKKFDDPRAYFFQNTDGRIIFAIPYEEDFTLIGTTDHDYRRRPARRADQRRRDRLSLRCGQRIFRRAGQARRYRLDLFRRAPAL